MKTYRVVLLDQDAEQLQLLLDYVSQLPFLELTGAFGDPLLALPFLSTSPVDLLVLDIELTGLRGFDLLASLSRLPATIIATASRSDSLEAYDLGVVDYILKPIRYERFVQAVNRALLRQPPTPGSLPPAARVLSLRRGHESVQVPVDQIMHIEAAGASVKLFLGQQEPVVVRHQLNELLDMLPPNQFVRVHRAFIVALPSVTSFSNRYITVDSYLIPIGRAYQRDVLALLNPKKPL